MFFDLCAISAHADLLDFKAELVNDELCAVYGGASCDPQTLEFTIQQNPIPTSYDDTSFIVSDDNNNYIPIHIIKPFLGLGTDFTFSGSVLVLAGNGDRNVLELYGPSSGFYVGPTSAPTLITGTFDTGAYLEGQSYNASGTLTITDLDAVPTPEPSSIMLLGTGLCGLLGVIARRVV